MANQLLQGKQVEKEHRKTYNFFKKSCQQGRCPTKEKFFESIAKEHLHEDKNYYSKLKKLKL